MLVIANSAYPDEMQQSEVSHLCLQCLLICAFMKEFFKKVNFEIKFADVKKAWTVK